MKYKLNKSTNKNINRKGGVKLQFFSLILIILFGVLFYAKPAYASGFGFEFKFKTNDKYYYEATSGNRNKSAVLFYTYEPITIDDLTIHGDKPRFASEIAKFKKCNVFYKFDCSSFSYRLSNNGNALILSTSYGYSNGEGKLIAFSLNGTNEEEYTSYFGRYYYPSGEIASYKFWRKYDNVDSPTIKEIKPDYSSIKSSVDSLVNNQINTFNNAVLSIKDYVLNFSYSDYELKKFIESASYSDLTTHFSYYYNGVNLNNMPVPSATYYTTIDNDNDMISYINNISNNCVSQLNYLNTYGRAFINSYNNMYNYMKSMRAPDLKKFLAYCVNTNSNLLGKCIFIYKDLIGINAKLYLPSNYVNTVFRDYKNYNNSTWYSLQNEQFEVLECVKYNTLSNIDKLSIK